MDAKDRGKIILTVLISALALALPLALLIVGSMGLWRDHRAAQASEKEFQQALEQSLQRAAETVMPAPSSGLEPVIVECPEEKFQSELQRVVRLARGLGGTASSWNDGQEVRIMANVPSSAEQLFRQSIVTGVYDLNSATESKTMVVVEVLLRPKSLTP
jgi:hypothetical protein